MQRSRLWALAAVTTLLAACPAASKNTQATLSLQALAVTQWDTTRGLPAYNVYLAWNAVPRATSYDVLAGSSTAALNSITPTPTAQTQYTDTALQSGASQSYQIRALDVNAVELLRSNIAGIQMLSHDASLSAAQDNIYISGAPTGGTKASDAPTAQPTLTWAPAPDATSYYFELTQGSASGAPVFATVSSTGSVTIGSFANAKIDWPNYSQVGSGFSLVAGTTYTATVLPLRTNTSDLASVSGIDVGPAATGPIIFN